MLKKTDSHGLLDQISSIQLFFQRVRVSKRNTSLFQTHAQVQADEISRKTRTSLVLTHSGLEIFQYK